MKLKRLSIGLGITLCSAFAFLLTSCEGSKKVTYLDEEGNEQSVNIKKTSDEEEVADALVAFLFSKGNAKFKPNGVGVSVSAEAKATGTQVSNNKKVTYGGSASAKAQFTFGDYEKTQNIDSYAAYSEEKVSVTVPTDLIASGDINLFNDDVLLASLSSTEIDYSKTSKITVAAREYANKDAVYLNVTKLDLPYDDIEAIKPYKSLINDNIVGKYIKLDEKAASLMPIDEDITGVLFNMDAYAKSYYELYTDETTFIDTIYQGITSEVTPSQAKEKIIEGLKETNIVISSVDGNKMTVKYNFAKKDASSDEYNGKSFVAVTVDLVKKVPTAVNADLGDYLTYMYETTEGKNENAPVKDASFTLKCSANITYSPSVTKISKKSAENATDISALMNVLS